MIFDRTNFDLKYDIASQIQGWFNKADMLSLHKLFLRFDTPINVLEIGTWKARSTIFSLLSLPKKSVLTAIDIFPNANDHSFVSNDICGKISGDDLYALCSYNINAACHEYRSDLNSVLIRADSKKMLPLWINDDTYKKFDLVFIDGDHRYEGFAIDFFNSIKLLSPSGILCGHDYGHSGPDVVKFLSLLGDSLFYLIEKESSVWVLDSNELDIAKERIKRIEKIMKWKFQL